MQSARLIIPGAMLVGAMALTACGPSKAEQAEIETCTKIARAVLHDPETFKVGETRVEETSEGVAIFVEIDYSGAEGSGHVSDRCWFGGYAEKKPLKRFSYRSDSDSQYVELPDDQLQELLKQLQG